MDLVCCAVSVISSFAIISLGKRELVALILLYFDVRLSVSVSRCRGMVCSV